MINGEQGKEMTNSPSHSEGGKPVRPITLYDSDRLRVRLAAFLDTSRTALRGVAPIVDLLVRLSLAKAFFAPGMLPGGDIGDFHATWPIIAARVTGPVLLARGFSSGP